MTMIVCKLYDCIHNRDERCQCTTIGIENKTVFGFVRAICGSYMKTPEILKQHLEAHNGT